MLGMRQSDAPIRGEFARDVRMQLWRIATGNPNATDKQMGALHEQMLKGQQYQISWNK